MNDLRLRVFRSAVDDLVESLQAVIRLARWDGAEPEPEPLVAAAARLQDRLGAAGRLATTRFQGPAREVTKVEGICKALGTLDAAYLAFRRQMQASPAGSPAREEALATLEAEIAAATADSAAWR